MQTNMLKYMKYIANTIVKSKTSQKTKHYLKTIETLKKTKKQCQLLKLLNFCSE